MKRRATPRRRAAPRWTAEQWAEANLRLWLRCGGRCWWCSLDLGESADRHHRQRRRDGGDRDENVILLHPWCHTVGKGSVHSEPLRAVEHGFIVPSTGDPATAPILIGRAFYTLTADGEKKIV